MSTPARVLLVDDSVVTRGLLSRIIDAEGDMEVAGTAANGKIGVEKVRALDLDLVVLDVQMPVMSGLDALREIRTTHPDLPVIMFSNLTTQGAAITFDALAAGATDTLAKPTSGDTVVRAMDQVRVELVDRVRALVAAAAGRRRRASARTAPASGRPARPVAPSAPVTTRASSRQRPVRAVVVGSSTGGPVALERVLTGLDRPLPVPMFVVQHMPVRFTAALAERLDKKTIHRVLEADGRTRPEDGAVYIAPGGQHMRLAADGSDVQLVVFDGPPVNSCVPSVDPLFSSAATVYGGDVLAVMLTGMGADGTEGTTRLAAAGADVIAQDEDTSVVWGMPGSVVAEGLATEILPLDRIGPRIGELVVGPAAVAAGPVRVGSGGAP